MNKQFCENVYCWLRNAIHCPQVGCSNYISLNANHNHILIKWCSFIVDSAVVICRLFNLRFLTQPLLCPIGHPITNMNECYQTISFQPLDWSRAETNIPPLCRVIKLQNRRQQNPDDRRENGNSFLEFPIHLLDSSSAESITWRNYVSWNTIYKLIGNSTWAAHRSLDDCDYVSSSMLSGSLQFIYQRVIVVAIWQCEWETFHRTMVYSPHRNNRVDGGVNLIWTNHRERMTLRNIRKSPEQRYSMRSCQPVSVCWTEIGFVYFKLSFCCQMWFYRIRAKNLDSSELQVKLKERIIQLRLALIDTNYLADMAFGNRYIEKVIKHRQALNYSKAIQWQSMEWLTVKASFESPNNKLPVIINYLNQWYFINPLPLIIPTSWIRLSVSSGNIKFCWWQCHAVEYLSTATQQGNPQRTGFCTPYNDTHTEWMWRFWRHSAGLGNILILITPIGIN